MSSLSSQSAPVVPLTAQNSASSNRLLADNIDEPRQMTHMMAKSLQGLHDALQCPLCSQVLTQPSTLACSHSFCQPCLARYNVDHWECPECLGPINAAGSVRQINPTLTSMTTSYHNILNILQRAPDRWWIPEDDNSVDSTAPVGSPLSLKDSSSVEEDEQDDDSLQRTN